MVQIRERMITIRNSCQQLISGPTTICTETNKTGTADL